MPYLKLTKTAVETARPEARDYELRDTTLIADPMFRISSKRDATVATQSSLFISPKFRILR